MTQDRRQALADRLLAEHVAQVDFIRGSIGLLAVLPILYGLSTWIFGDDLWGGADVYRTALTLPGAPQSWGTVFIVIGVALMACAFRRMYRAVQVVSMVAALVFGMFMITFGVEYAQRSNESSIPPAIAWMVFSLLFLNLWRLAAKMRQLEIRYGRLSAALDELET